MKKILENRRITGIGGVPECANSITIPKLEKAVVMQIAKIVETVLNFNSGKRPKDIIVDVDDLNLLNEVVKYKIREIEQGGEAHYLNLLLDLFENTSKGIDRFKELRYEEITILAWKEGVDKLIEFTKSFIPINELKRSKPWEEKERKAAVKAFEELLNSFSVEATEALIKSCLIKVKERMNALIETHNFRGLYKYYFLLIEIVDYADDQDGGDAEDLINFPFFKDLIEVCRKVINFLDKVKIRG